MYSRFQDADTTENIDVLLVGSSHAYRSLDPRKFAQEGISSFVLGSSGQTPKQAKILVERYLEQFNPKVVVYEVYPGGFKSDGVESMCNIISTSKLDWPVIKVALTYKNPKVYNTLLYGLIERKLFGNTVEEEPLYRKWTNDQYIPGGYVETDRLREADDNFGSAEMYFEEDQLRAFQDILKMIERKGISTLLVFAPVTQEFYRSIGGLPPFESVMAAEAPYVDFNKTDLMLNDSLDFYDYHHLNKFGVEKFNEALLDTIRPFLHNN